MKLICINLCLTICLASGLGFAQKKYLNTYPDDIPYGSLRLVQVTNFFSREEVMKDKKAHDALLKLGVTEEEMIDGRFGKGKIYCCGGAAEGPTRQLFYVPTEMIGQVYPSDIIEIRAGRKPTGQIKEDINILVRVVQTTNSTEDSCHWIPENPRLWMRCLYCDWMEKEGWIEFKKKLDHTWYKPSVLK